MEQVQRVDIIIRMMFLGFVSPVPRLGSVPELVTRSNMVDPLRSYTPMIVSVLAGY
jgi:hypothetical protein